MSFKDEIQLIMVSYHRPNDLKKCVSSILSNTSEPFHLHICDNSHGKIDDLLSTFNDPRITIHKNNSNLGKGKAFMKWYYHIMKQCRMDFFISIDPDLIVPNDWLIKMYLANLKLKKFHSTGILAPIIMNTLDDTFSAQIKRNKLTMHRMDNPPLYINNILKNRYTAGPLFLIDRKFFETVGGYSQNQLYGNDDGNLCKLAHKHNRFIGIVTDVEVLHLQSDNDNGYIEWKKRNIHSNTDNKGYWD